MPVPENNPVKMKYKNLGDVQITFQKIFSCDVNDDGKKDFSITSELIGKPSEQSDYHSYFFTGGLSTYSPINSDEEAPLLNAGDNISLNAYPNHEWYNVAQITLSEKIIPMHGNDFWKGKWKDATHKYLAFAIEKNGERYYGWLELSFSQNAGAVILHRTAVAEEVGKHVFAGK